MSSNKNYGTCAICQRDGELTYEHIPPRSSFHHRGIYATELEEHIKADQEGREPKSRKQRKGSGGYTLCGNCNSFLGGEYVQAYTSWVIQIERHRPTLPSGAVSLPFKLSQLRIIKQIAAMFCSLNPDTKITKDIGPFILNKKQTGLPSNYRFFAYCTFGNKGRTIPFVAKVHTSRLSNRISLLSEISFRPLGMIMTANGNLPAADLLEITHFTRARLDDECTKYYPMTNRHVESHFPADFTPSKNKS